MVNDQHELAEQFLLGKLTDEQRSETEIEFFQSSSSFENILIAENSLTDAYVAGRLSFDDRRLFEQRLLINPRQRERAAFAKTLIKYASSLPVEITDETSRSNWAITLVRYLSGQPLASYSLGAAVFLILAGGAFWWTSNNLLPANDELAKIVTQPTLETRVPVPGNEPEVRTLLENKNEGVSPTETNSEPERGSRPVQDRTSRQAKPAESITSSRMISTIILSLGSTRDAGTAKAYILPRGASSVKLQIGFENGEFPKSFAVVETVDGQQIWSGKASYRGSKDARYVTVTVPGARLKSGDYIVTLKGSARGTLYETIGEYSFTVERR